MGWMDATRPEVQVGCLGTVLVIWALGSQLARSIGSEMYK